MVHVVYNGRTQDLTMEQVFPQGRLANIGVAEGTEVSAATLNAQQVKTALAQFFDVGLGEFNDHYVDFNTKAGNITVRPNTEFGNA